MRAIVLCNWIRAVPDSEEWTSQLTSDFPGLSWEDVTGQAAFPTAGYLIAVPNSAMPGVDPSVIAAIAAHPDYVVCREMNDDGTVIRDRLRAVTDRLSARGVDMSDARDVDDVRVRLRTLPKVGTDDPRLTSTDGSDGNER